MHCNTRSCNTRRNQTGVRMMPESEVSARRNGRKTAVARSAFMKSEEIDREREMSGWNPYAGEEEEMPVPGRRMENSGTDENVQQIQPYFTMPDYTQILEEQQQTERDFRKLQSMYPEAAKMMLPYIEEECDKMEYEGSMMFDEYPDQTTVYRIGERIYDEVKDQFPDENPEQPDDVLSMQYQGPNRNRPGQNWVQDLARVLLLQEMHHRRCRHRGCRRGRI